LLESSMTIFNHPFSTESFVPGSAIRMCCVNIAPFFNKIQLQH
jgi:hypothetical protein